MKTHIIVFAKAPTPGKVKTRLIPSLGERGATALARKMLIDTLDKARAANADSVELCTTQLHAEVWKGILPIGDITVSEQICGDLGAKMAAATQRTLAQGKTPVLIGTDCPELDSTHLRRAMHSLKHNDVVLTPVHDGGYALIAMRDFYPELFINMPWSTGAVAVITRARCQRLGLSVMQMPTLLDIDEAEDLAAYQHTLNCNEYNHV